MFCASKEEIIAIDCAAIESSRGVSWNYRLDKAQEVFDRFWEPNSEIFGMDEDERAARRGKLKMPRAANDQTVSAMS